MEDPRETERRRAAAEQAAIVAIQRFVSGQLADELLIRSTWRKWRRSELMREASPIGIAAAQGRL